MDLVIQTNLLALIYSYFVQFFKFILKDMSFVNLINAFPKLITFYLLISFLNDFI